MSRLRRQPARPPATRAPQRLPLRWAIIAIVTAGASLVGHLVGGPIAAISCGAAIAVAAHQLLD